MSTSFEKMRLAAVLAVAVVGFGSNARGAFRIQLRQTGSKVFATGNGVLNLSALTSIGTTTDPGFIASSLGFLSVGPPTLSRTTFYSGLRGPISFGSGTSFDSDMGSGSQVLIAGRYEEFGVPEGYVSGAPLSDSAVFSGTLETLGITPGNYTWSWGDDTAADSLTVATSSVPGDATYDGRVNFDDLIILAQHYNLTTGQTWGTGDFTGDGAVNFNDLVILAQYYGPGPAVIDGSSPAFTADWALAKSLVPEPGMMTLGLAAGVMLVLQRRGRQ